MAKTTKKRTKKKTTTRRANDATAAPAATANDVVRVRREKDKIWSHVRQKWLVETPEERVRQEYLCILVNEYGFTLSQIAEEESVTGRGSAQARADFLIWRSALDRADDRPALIVIECKSDNVTIQTADYSQGDNYARREGAKFFVTHNNRETRFWRVRTDRRPGYLEEIENIPHADATDRDIKELIAKLKTFKEDEFADLLHNCHNVIRNREHLDPAAAFDEIAKVLFVKTWVEREMRQRRQRNNLFTADWLDEQLGDSPLNDLFQKTKAAFREDRIFGDDDRMNLKAATGREIVRLLERYNLSDTSEDVKGIAFERFLGRTFRGEIGQFFTPRPLVEFMVRMVEPAEGDVLCDPASGSGGFLIRFFEIVREQALADVDRQYQTYIEELEGKKLSNKKRAELLRDRFERLQATIDQHKRSSRLWQLANRCIYGCDANDRMARTSKMNMIMHGDGHGGVHHHNGFINVNGIFERRFDIILTNPPFGANVEPSDRITAGDVRTTDEQERRYADIYGQAYKDAQARVKTAAEAKEPIASMFDLPYGGNKTTNIKKKLGNVKTEILFIERCLALLKPGGRLGIVLPEGIFNNPSLAYVREFCEDRAFIRAVVSLPQETFYSSGASVKGSILFMQKFTEEEAADFATKRQAATAEVDTKYKSKIDAETAGMKAKIDAAKKAKDADKRKATQAELRQYVKQMADTKAREARKLLKELFAYPIFLYDAKHVGITATGEQDACELYPNPRQPTEKTTTCLGDYQAFTSDPTPFDISAKSRLPARKGKIRLLPPSPRHGPFALSWSSLERWDIFFWREDFVALDLQLLAQDHMVLGDILNFISRSWRKPDFPTGEFQYIEISSVTREGGITSTSPVKVDDTPSRATTLVMAGDFILATTRPYLGAFARVGQEYDRCVCSSAFALADGLKTDRVCPDYLLMFLKGPAGLRQMERRMTGGLYPAIIQGELEKVIVPVPKMEHQKAIVATIKSANNEICRVRQEADQRVSDIQDLANRALLGEGKAKADVEAMILGEKKVQGS